MKTTILLTAALALPLMLAGTDTRAQTMTVTTDNGGSVVSTRDCQRQPGLAECTGSTTATTANGKTATRLRQRSTTADGSQTTVSRTNPAGQTKGWVRTLGN